MMLRVLVIESMGKDDITLMVKGFYRLFFFCIE